MPLKYEYDVAFWFDIWISYEKAKRQKRVIDFYLGRDEYFHRNSDFGCHDTSTSFESLIYYSDKYGNRKMLNSFKSDIENILKSDLTAH